MARESKKRMEVICENCKKIIHYKMLDESDKALARYTKKLKKELKEIKNDTSKQSKRK